MKKVLLDTNFFLLPFQNKIDIFKLVDKIVDSPRIYIISSGVAKELEKIAKNKGKTGAAARLGLKILKLHEKEIEIVDSGQPVDAWIMDYAVKNNAVVCTNDKQLKNKLKQKGIQVITTKGKDWLGFV